MRYSLIERLRRSILVIFSFAVDPSAEQMKEMSGGLLWLVFAFAGNGTFVIGNLNATAVFRGESAHSARPWQGVNAIDLAVEGLAPVVAVPPLEVEVGGLTFVEVLSATRIQGGIASNVIPDRVEVGFNYRYAPNRTPAEAEARRTEPAVPGRSS
jgi:metal-dependent amidase/aminoacylase/carboxypeptidase family protein